MKKKLILILGLVCFIGISAKYFAKSTSGTNQEKFDYEQWGKALKEDASVAGESDDIVYKGNTADIKESEIKKGTAFYEAAGMSSDEAEKEAVEYLKKFEAIYAEAIEKGYSVTDKEVEEYLNTMRNSLSGSEIDEETKKEYEAMLEQFDSEEDYWNYQKIIYRKELPIQNYVSDLEEQYFQDRPEAADDEWLEYFEEYKSQLALMQSFKNVSK